MSIIVRKISDELSCFIEIVDKELTSEVILSKSENSSLECEIKHKYDGLEYVSFPHNNRVYIECDSLREKFSKS